MRITYDKDADTAYIYLIDDADITSGWVKRTYPCDPVENKSMINLDFTKNNILGGIEVIEASKLLHPNLLNNAWRIDK